MEIMQPEPAPSTRTQALTFTGSAGEFFSIWIVNVVLSILTLGIYSAWAKVRTQQYFYGNTWLDDVSFRYLADPIRILKGRLIAFALFALYAYGSHFAPMIAGLVMLFIALLFPALLVLSMSFKMRYSSYRNVRFGFEKNYLRAYSIFILPVLVIAAYLVLVMQVQQVAHSPEELKKYMPFVALLGFAVPLLFPYIEFKITQFKVVNSRYGQTGFDFSATGGQYYRLYLGAGVLFAVVALLIFIVLAGLGGAFQVDRNNDASNAAFVSVYMLVFLPLYLWFFAYIQTKRINLVFNNITVGNDIRLQSGLRVGYMMYLYFTNTLAIAVSLGLLIPWARIRTARYRLGHTQVEMAGDLEQFANDELRDQAAVGEEIGDLFDLDIGF